MLYRYDRYVRLGQFNRWRWLNVWRRKRTSNTGSFVFSWVIFEWSISSKCRWTRGAAFVTFPMLQISTPWFTAISATWQFINYVTVSNAFPKMTGFATLVFTGKRNAVKWVLVQYHCQFIENDSLNCVSKFRFQNVIQDPLVDPKSKPIRCVLCERTTGAMKECHGEGKDAWAHMVCALFIEEVYFHDTQNSSGIIISGIPPSKRVSPTRRCSFCPKGGIVVDCQCELAECKKKEWLVGRIQL